jgi:hypothetical protein
LVVVPLVAAAGLTGFGNGNGNGGLLAAAAGSAAAALADSAAAALAGSAAACCGAGLVGARTGSTAGVWGGAATATANSVGPSGAGCSTTSRCNSTAAPASVGLLHWLSLLVGPGPGTAQRGVLAGPPWADFWQNGATANDCPP